jgi:MaoC like domain
MTVANNSPVFDQPSIAGAAIGQEFASRPLIFSLARILAFSGGSFAEPNWPARNLHTDIEKAREAGLPGIIASGTQTEGILVEMLIGLFGEAWLHRGVIEIKFPRSVFVDDTVRCRAVLQAIERQGSRDRYRLDVWCENQAGDKVIIGTAACALDPSPGAGR